MGLNPQIYLHLVIGSAGKHGCRENIIYPENCSESKSIRD